MEVDDNKNRHHSKPKMITEGLDGTCGCFKCPPTFRKHAYKEIGTLSAKGRIMEVLEVQAAWSLLNCSTLSQQESHHRQYVNEWP